MGPGRDSGAVSDFAAEQFELARKALEWNWGEAYEIGVNADGWRAKRRDGKGEVRANSPDGLREAIFADYTALPVPRDAAGAGE